MLVGIHQPHYLPWLRYFEKVARCDFFILLDDVSFTRNGWQNRNRIKTGQGAHILTVPVKQKLGMPINEVLVSQQEPWARKHWMTLRQSYAEAPHFADFGSDLESFYATPWPRLVDLNRAMFKHHLEALGLKVGWTLSSELQPEGSATERLVSLVRAVGGTGYLSGRHALGEYLDAGVFRKAGLDLWIFDWTCPEYPQVHPRQGFVRDLATLDLLFMQGGATARATLASGGKVSRYED